jgi:hypothetical protein
MRRYLSLAIVAPLLALGGCATAGSGAGPVDVTRFHLAGADGQIARGTIAIVPLTDSPLDSQSLEFRSYAAAVSEQLRQIGYLPVADAAGAAYLARVNYRRATRAAPPRRSPVSVGVGGSTGSYGSGVGVGVGISLGGKRHGEVLTELSVAIERRTDASVVWEGRADTAAREGSDAATVTALANKLAAALFRGFPGESGRTITVP